MSRVGKLPVQVADDIKVEVSGLLVMDPGIQEVPPVRPSASLLPLLPVVLGYGNPVTSASTKEDLQAGSRFFFPPFSFFTEKVRIVDTLLILRQSQLWINMDE